MNDKATAVALATRIRQTLVVREASYQPFESKGPHSIGWYKKSTESAAREAGVEEDLLGVVIALVDGSALEVHGWAKRILNV
jgi:hypothetical protein